MGPGITMMTWTMSMSTSRDLASITTMKILAMGTMTGTIYAALAVCPEKDIILPYR